MARKTIASVMLAVAAVTGVIHGGFSVYWGLGGEFLVGTLGSDLVELWEENAVLLLPVGLLKIVAALLPMVLVTAWFPTWPWWLRRLLRTVSWLGAVSLVVWGGVNTVVGNLVLSGVIEPGDGYDRDGMMGHAWYWDPMFLIWGAALAAGLWLSRRITEPSAHASRRSSRT
ncbi:MAG: DUF3995 domain-containing protein [Mycobacteriaceae bacterium]|uniref:DUF3995 domain-containing protein n=1 Tax=Corynebacterium sp. TaxID=1720 RepID=UPI003F98F313